MLEGLKKFFTGKDESKSENQRNSGNGVDFEKHSNDNVEQQENYDRAERTRFTLMAESYAAVEGDRLSVEGQLFGNAKEGEKAYALHRDGTISHLTLMKIEKSASFVEQAKKEEQEETPETQGQRRVKLFFSQKDVLSSDWQYAVITDIPYQIEANVNQAVENPYLLGLSCVFFERQGEGEFLNLFFRELVRSHYLVVIETDGGLPKGDTKGGDEDYHPSCYHGPGRISPSGIYGLVCTRRHGSANGVYESADGGRMEKRNHDCRFPSNCVHAY